jgi:hypothetical protein
VEEQNGAVAGHSLTGTDENMAGTTTGADGQQRVPRFNEDLYCKHGGRRKTKLMFFKINSLNLKEVSHAKLNAYGYQERIGTQWHAVYSIILIQCHAQSWNALNVEKKLTLATDIHFYSFNFLNQN